jgi:phosphoribosylanthranilate isomerase
VLTRTKICGITCAPDLSAALNGGADAVGFLVGQKHPSRDFISVELAKGLLWLVPPFVTTVLVTHEDDVREILALATAIPAQVLQLHSNLGGSELKSTRERLAPRAIIGKITVEGDRCVERLLDIQPFVDAILLDSANRVTGQVGGTGLVHDWRTSAHLRTLSERPIILAGGLRPSNVGEAIAIVQPAAVDVNSGVEDEHAMKSPALISDFVAAVRGR